MRILINKFTTKYPGSSLLSLSFLVFVLIDAFWLLSLSRWGISYGPPLPVWVIFTILRSASLALCMLLFPKTALSRYPYLNLRYLSFFGINLSLLVFAVYGFCIEPFHLTQTSITVKVPGLERPVRIVQLSDIHVEYLTRREEELPGFIERLQPDFIVMTGDYTSEEFTNDEETDNHLRTLVNRFSAPMGVYAVNGNAEFVYVMDLLFEGTNVHLLENKVLMIPELDERVALVGLNHIQPERDAASLKELMSQLSADVFSILLYHKPDLAYDARDAGVDLYLCGHTHGGQVRLPLIGALITNSRYGKTFEMGSYTLDGMTLFVNRGLGFTGGNAPRIRFLAPPEVAVIDLIPAK